MASLTIRDLPREVYERLRQRAQRHRRSLTQEAAFLLERALDEPDARALWAQVDVVRERLQGRYGSFPDSTPGIREDREREERADSGARPARGKRRKRSGR
ncbi:MAG: FitA-like ribbon-helix-helix domain-containing protein [Gemmatimonadota bacterium]